jgi:ubiquinone/menaquinone biosynthesis C-methylase UbiE
MRDRRPGSLDRARDSARLVGIDVSEVAISEARERALKLGLGDAAEYRRSGFEATGLPAASVDGAFSVDALVYASDIMAALREIVRILRPGARFVATTFEIDPDRARQRGVTVDSAQQDYRPALEAAGLQIHTYQATPGWHERLAATYHGLTDAAQDLRREVDATALKVLLAELSRGVEDRVTTRRVFIAAEKTIAQ